MDKESVKRLEKKIDDIHEASSQTRLDVAIVKTKLEIANVVDLRSHVDFVRRGTKVLLALIAAGGTILGVLSLNAAKNSQSLRSHQLKEIPVQSYQAQDDHSFSLGGQFSFDKPLPRSDVN